MLANPLKSFVELNYANLILNKLRLIEAHASVCCFKQVEK